MSENMHEIIKWLGMGVLFIAYGLASYKRGWWDGYGEASEECSENLKRQKMKHWYKRLYGTNDQQEVQKQ